MVDDTASLPSAIFILSSTVMEVVIGPRDEIPADNNVSSILATTASLTAIALFVVLLRLYVRTFMIKSFGWDDWVMALTAVSNGCEYTNIRADKLDRVQR